ncbi:phosphoribosyltransferase family protein [Sporomusa sphaeroides]|uniref:Adenine phosphoribosyltransferase n=1 Tax=Sporomusa sphaeroides DSM 2875 TaxID=1337886 RepID=A0ABM9W1T0_9FIRM|nr:phosphoribosyltransferase family protein [Sporomusa sphaeroides]OLS56220.1 adenine phosphoribosyltransferase [Sporomusa sphaeroides DSM 2875]CVK19138.1 Adenine phosphoribosyltransferase [Sporomusa sphaeroides DSM 2875]
MLKKSFDNCDLLNINGKNFIINELTEQIPATTPALLKQAAEKVVELLKLNDVNKIVGEEEKGAVLVAVVSLLTGLPFGLARWYPSGLRGQIVVDFSCEYTDGQIFLNGVEAGDRVVIVDDMISTGGTMIALIDAIRKAGAEIVDVVAVAAKEEYGGIQRIKAATGIDVKTVLVVSVSGNKSLVKWYEE